jgi:hypothetical protein
VLSPLLGNRLGGQHAFHQRRQQRADFLRRQILPLEAKESRDRLRREVFANLPRRHALTMVYGGTSFVTTAHAPTMAPSPMWTPLMICRRVADPDVVADDNVALVVPGLGDRHRIEPPFAEEDQDGVGRNGIILAS